MRAQQGALAHNPCCHTTQPHHPTPPAKEVADDLCESIYENEKVSDSMTQVTISQTRLDNCLAPVARPQIQPRPTKATLATQNEGRCCQAPRLPATHNAGACRQVQPLPRKSAAASRATKRTQARHTTQPSVRSAKPAMQNESRCRQVPRPPRTTQVHVAKCHACHVNAAASRATKRTKTIRPSDVSEVPCLPRNTKVDVAKCHACHAKVPRRPGRPSGPKPATQPSPVSEVPSLPCKTKVDVAKCHARSAQRRCMSPSATPATQKCRGVLGDQADPRAPHNQCQKCQACHAKRKSMSPSATPAAHNADACRQVPHLPRKIAAASRATKRTQVRHTTQLSVRSQLCVKDGV